MKRVLFWHQRLIHELNQRHRTETDCLAVCDSAYTPFTVTLVLQLSQPDSLSTSQVKFPLSLNVTSFISRVVTPSFRLISCRPPADSWLLLKNHEVWSSGDPLTEHCSRAVLPCLQAELASSLFTKTGGSAEQVVRENQCEEGIQNNNQEEREHIQKEEDMTEYMVFIFSTTH